MSEAAAPLAGLSAATLAYSAAAMLPVWLPAALGRKKRDAKEEVVMMLEKISAKEEKDKAVLMKQSRILSALHQ